MSKILHVLRVSFSALMLVAILFTASPVSPAAAAGILEVNSDADTNANDGFCTLREAITAANTDTTSGAAAGECAAGSGADEITFAGDYTITLGSQLPAITSNITITGNGASNTIVQASVSPSSATYRVFEVGGAGNLTLDGLTIQYGWCYTNACATIADAGGGILNAGTLVVANSFFDRNISGSSGVGGAIHNASGNVTVTDSFFSDNQAAGGGNISNDGGILSISNSTFIRDTVSLSSAGSGGGISNYNSGTLTVQNSTFKNLLAMSYEGGAIFNGSGTATITNSTFDGNHTNAGYGGAVYNGGSNTMNIVNSTFANNSTNGSTYPAGGGGIYGNPTGTTNLYNTIIANSTAGGDCAGTVNADTYNMDTDGTCGSATQKTPAELNLDFLEYNGGPTPTVALLPGSHAIDAGDDAVCAAAVGSPSYGAGGLDQRGVARPQMNHCDVGSYERQPTYIKKIFKSQGKYDGWVLESSESSGVGGLKNNTGKTLLVGDDAQDRQYRTILSFGTASIPDNAVVTKVVLKVKKAGVAGNNPINTHNNLVVDIKKGKFSTLPAVQIEDFQAKAAKNKTGKFSKKLFSGWYKSVLYKGAYPYINVKGTTQFRLRFLLDDNDNNFADILKLYSGNAVLADRPKLIVRYYVP